MNMKEYPKIDWKEFTQEQKKLFDMIEDIILWNNEVLEDTWVQTIDVIAYNSAFSILTDNRLAVYEVKKV